MDATTIVKDLESGKPVFVKRARVNGSIMLNATGAKLSSLVLIESVVDGDLDASFARFSGPVRFTGSCFTGGVQLKSAVFEDEVNWQGATFASQLNAEGAHFLHLADLRAETYSGVNFTDATFSGRTLFEGSRFNSSATFFGVLFEEDTSFRRAQFDETDFEATTATGNIDFSNAKFGGNAKLRRFASPKTVDLSNARFNGHQVILDNAAISQLDLSGVVPATNTQFAMDGLAVDRLKVSLSLVNKMSVRDTKHAVLALIDKSARAGHDTELANDALFTNKALKTGERRGMDRVLWTVLELTTGYLVRPMRPLFVMLSIFSLGFVVRLTGRASYAAKKLRQANGVYSTEAHAPSRSYWRFISIFAPAGEALAAGLDPHPPKPALDVTRGETYVLAFFIWLEYCLQKSLTVVFLISLGNANPTLREIITSII